MWKERRLKLHLQHVADDANRPEIRPVADLFEINHFGSDEFRCSEEDLKLLGRIVSTCKAKIDQLNPIARSC